MILRLGMAAISQQPGCEGRCYKACLMAADCSVAPAYLLCMALLPQLLQFSVLLLLHRLQGKTQPRHARGWTRQTRGRVGKWSACAWAHLQCNNVSPRLFQARAHVLDAFLACSIVLSLLRELQLELRLSLCGATRAGVHRSHKSDSPGAASWARRCRY